MTIVAGRQRRNKPPVTVVVKPKGTWIHNGSGRSVFVLDTTAPTEPAAAEEAGNSGSLKGEG